jgi:acyl-CoA synthetase (AMP-forming)/AMP-acid ligase II
VAFVVGNDTVDPAALRQYCRDRLVADKVPAEIILVDDLPKTSVGKIRKRELAKQWGGQT